MMKLSLGLRVRSRLLPLLMLAASVACTGGGSGGTGGGSGTGGGTAATGGGTSSTGGGTSSTGGGTSGSGGGTSSTGGGTSSTGGGTSGTGGGTSGSGGGTSGTGGGTSGTGGGTSGTGGGTSGTGGGTSGTGGGTSGTGGGAGGTGGGAGGETGTTKSGYVSLSQYCLTLNGIAYCGANATAAFFTIPSTGGCAQSTVGPCTVMTCSSDGGFVPYVTDSAGNITISGTRAGPITLAPIDGGYSYYTSSSDKLWDGGETVTVTATGATVPAFSTSLTAPTPIGMTNPLCAMSDCGTFSRSTSLPVSWSPANAPALVFVISSTTAQVMFAQCTLTTSPGSVPSSVMSLIGATDAGYTNSFALYSTATSTVTPGNGYVINVQMYDLAASGSFDTVP
jgi:hypothetical protein